MIGLSAIKENIKTIGLVVGAVGILGMVGTIIVQRANLKAATIELSQEKDKRLAAEVALNDANKKFSAQLSNIKTLEVQRQQNQAMTDPFYIRLDQLETPTKDATNVESSLADRLNGLNADTNRLLSDGTK